MIFYSWVVPIWFELRWLRGEYFFPPVNNLMNIWYFTTAMILGCEQVKIFLIVELCYSVISNICWILILNMCILCFSLFWYSFYMWNNKTDGYPIPVRNLMGMGMHFYLQVWIWIFIHNLFTDRWIITLSDSNFVAFPTKKVYRAYLGHPWLVFFLLLPAASSNATSRI
jgi:hypothetical protein